MKYLLIFSIALIISLSSFKKYKCILDGELIYYGSPFIYKLESGSSLEYFYSISGLLLNLGLWSSIIYLIYLINDEFIKFYDKIFFYSLVFVISILLIFNFLILYLELGGFSLHLIEWKFI